jgi:hypothetical protein
MPGFRFEPKIKALLISECPIVSTCLPIMSIIEMRIISSGLLSLILMADVNGLGYNSTELFKRVT